MHSNELPVSKGPSPVPVPVGESRTHHYVKNKDLNRLLIDTAVREQWALLDSYLTQILSNEQARGAPLLKALNLPVGNSDMPLLGVMLLHNAPLAMIERVIEIGASTAFRCSVREPGGTVVRGCTMMHLALVLGRLDIVSRASPRGLRIPLENERGECPLRQLGRLAPNAAFDNENIIRAIGVATRRYVSAGGSGAELSRALSLFISRKAWGAAETILDTLTSIDGLEESAKLKGNGVCNWALFAVHQNAPLSFFSSLNSLIAAGGHAGDLAFKRDIAKDMLQDFVPTDVLNPAIRSHDWGALESRLERLTLCREIFGSALLYQFVNVRNERFTLPPINAELEEIGLEDPVIQEKPLSLLHLMAYGGATARCFDLAFQLGVDATYQAWVGRAREVFFDGTALHVAAARGDLERLEIMIAHKAPLSQLNSAGETELQSLFSRHGNDLPISQLPIVQLLIRVVGEPSERKNVVGKSVRDLRINGYRFGELLDAAKKFDPQHPENASVTVVKAPATYDVLDSRGKLIQVNETILKNILLAEYKAHFHISGTGKREHRIESIDDLASKQRIVTIQNADVREIVEQLHFALTHPYFPIKPSIPPAPEEAAEVEFGALLDELEPDENSEEGEFLSFPEFGGADFGFTYEDPDLSDSDLENADIDSSAEFEIIEESALNAEDESAVETPSPASEPEDKKQSKESSPEKPKVFEKSLLETLSMTEDDIIEMLSEPAIKPDVDEAGDDFEDLFSDELDDDSEGITVGGTTPPSTSSLISSLIRGRLTAIESAVMRCVEEREYYEAYLLIKCMDELRVRKPSELDALSRSLRSLLYRFPPNVANRIGYILDEIPGPQYDGYHPYMAEFCCLLHNPLDERKNASSIGGLTVGISSFGQLYRFGDVTGELVNAWGDIGTLNFAFPIWRFDSQPIRLKGKGGHDQESLMERAGILKVENPVDEYWTNPDTNQQEHLLGAMFAIAKGVPFHEKFDHQSATKLGFAPLGRETVIAFRRACIIVSHPSHGTLVIRNSSHTFGRDRFRHFGAWHKDGLKLPEITSLTQKQIERKFLAVTSAEFFSQHKTGYADDEHDAPTYALAGRRSGRTIAQATQPLTFLTGQLKTARAALSRMKFDANISTAWSAEGAMIGGYRSPLFRSAVELIDDRFRLAKKDFGKTIVPELGFANPDYFLAPYSRLRTTEDAIEVLYQLADGEEAQVTEKALHRSGVRDFLNSGFSRGRSAELVLLAPEAQP